MPRTKKDPEPGYPDEPVKKKRPARVDQLRPSFGQMARALHNARHAAQRHASTPAECPQPPEHVDLELAKAIIADREGRAR